MKLRRLAESEGRFLFPDGQPFDSDHPSAKDGPVITPEGIRDVLVHGQLSLYHNSKSDNLEQTGILTRAAQNLPDLWKSGEDTTYQNAIYLSLYPVNHHGPHVYAVDTTGLDQYLFKADEDAPQHTTASIDFDDWVSSLMIMGSLRYEGPIPAGAVRRV